MKFGKFQIQKLNQRSEEIKAAQILKFGGYDVTFTKVTSGVRINCNGETGTFSQIQAIYNIVLKKRKDDVWQSKVKQIDYSDDTYWSLLFKSYSNFY